MMQKPQPEGADVGVIVGRFQTHELTAGHRDLIDTVRERHERVIVVLGLSPLMNTTKNPLPFNPRKEMILAEYPDVTVLYVKDTPSDYVWSERLDELVADTTSPTQSVVLYGSRDSFISSYHGRYRTDLWEPTIIVSASEVRNTLRARMFPSAPYRAGMVAAAMNRFPTSYTTVDIAVFDDRDRLLLAQKRDEDKWRLIGGFADPSDESFEAAAARELREEAGQIEVGPMKYVGSKLIDDWRYRNEVDKIKTILFQTQLVFGAPTPHDDIHRLRWAKFHEIDLIDEIVPEHIELIGMLEIPLF